MDQYDFGDDDGSAAAPEGSVEHSKQEVQQLILTFKLIMVCILYGYSAHQRKFREQNSNFDDSSTGLSKMIDSMMSKMA